MHRERYTGGHIFQSNGWTLCSLLSRTSGTLENDEDELLLSQEYVRRCREIYSSPTKALEANSHEFPIKHINILDPLKDNNNLGRSVSKGNFHRIRCALTYGAQRLKEILMLPGESIGMELEKFFTNTLERNGKGQRPDVRVAVPAFGTGRSVVSDLSGDYDSYYNGLLYGQCYHDYTVPVTGQFNPPSPPQIHNRSPWDMLCQFVRCKRYSFCRWGTEVFVPRFAINQPYVSQLPAATFCLDEVDKSRGTGTYIPKINHHSYRDKPASRARNPDSTALVLSKKFRKKFGKAEDSPDVENGVDECSLNLSMDEFPLLSVTKKRTAETNHQFDQSSVTSMKAQDCAPPAVSIKFGSFECSPLSSEQPSTPVMMGKQKQSERDEKMFILQPHHLRDANEFPPLSS